MVMDLKEALETIICLSLQVIRKYSWLLDLYVLDFFVDNHWEKLPSTWRQLLEVMDPSDLGKVMSGERTSHVLPLSMLALLKSVHSLTLNREPSPVGRNTMLSTQFDHLNVTKLKNIFFKHVKLKKRHEVAIVANIVDQLSSETACQSVVDFGSGLGHLARTLAYQLHLQAVGIEARAELTEEARKLDLELEETVKKFLKEEQMLRLHRPTHINMTLTCEEQLQKLNLPLTAHQYGLVGLHPCGDLTPLLLRHFASSQRVKFICVVGCCHMKLSCGEGSLGYPMSDYVTRLDQHDLSYVSREIACHAIETYVDRLKRGIYEDLKVHAYRAGLECVLRAAMPGVRHAPLRSVKHSHTLTFQRYCAEAVSHLPASVVLCPERMRQAARAVENWHRVVVLYSLRLVLAPLVETVLLLDRMLYLIEHGLSCELRAAFDPKISPRNHIIIGRRV